MINQCFTFNQAAKWRWLFPFVALFLVGLAVGSCKPKSASEKNQILSVEIGLTGTPDILDIPYFLAIEKDFFRTEGLQVKYRYIAGDATSVQALLSGSVDFASAGLFSIMRAVDRGAQIKAFVSVARSHDYMLVARSSIPSIPDLKGKIVGIFAPGDITETVAVAFFHMHGISRTDVSWVSLGGSSERFKALVTHRVDAVPLHSDDALRASGQSDLRVLANIAKEMPLPMSAVATRQTYLTSRRNLVEKIARALIRACSYANTHKEEFIEVAYRYLEGLSREQIGILYDQLRASGILAVDGGISPETIRNAQTALNVLGTPVIGDPERFADFSIAEAFRRTSEH